MATFDPFVFSVADAVIVDGIWMSPNIQARRGSSLILTLIWGLLKKQFER